MKTIVNDKAKYITAILSLIFISEIMFNINNRIIQTLGICIFVSVVRAMLFSNKGGK
jgi:hypothetical protein